MKKRLQGAAAGFLAGVLVAGAAFAANTVRIVVDGKEIHPTDVNGNLVSPIVQNGTTYLPVRAVAEALGKSVYWDGPNYTVYIGDMDGGLQYPTYELNIDDNIGDWWVESSDLKDNYGNIYTRAIKSFGAEPNFDMICNMKYSRFKGTIYVSNGCSSCDTGQITIKTDGKTVYRSGEMDKTSAPVNFDVDITGCNILEITVKGELWGCLNIGDAGLYQ